MQRYNGPQISRPQSMAQNRLDWKYKTAQPRLQSSHKPQRNSKEQKLNYQLNNPQLPSNFIYILVPKQKDKNITNILQQQQRKKLNTFSRENIQNMNKKYRQIRSSRNNAYVGLYDLQNDRRLLQTRAISTFNSQGEDLLSKEINNLNIKPRKIQQLQRKKVNKNRERGKSQPQHRQTQIDQQILKSNRNRQRVRPVKQTKIKKVGHKRAQSGDIFMPEKQSQTGYMCNKFESKLKKKSMQDNLHIMATLIRKKIKILDKKDMVIYLKKLTSTNNT